MKDVRNDVSAATSSRGRGGGGGQFWHLARRILLEPSVNYTLCVHLHSWTAHDIQLGNKS